MLVARWATIISLIVLVTIALGFDDSLGKTWQKTGCGIVSTTRRLTYSTTLRQSNGLFYYGNTKYYDE